MFSGNSFRPRFESLEARDQPTHFSFYDLLISSFQAPPPEIGEGGGQIEVESFSWGVTQTGTMAIA
jgi:hypothetical protein